MSIRRRKDQTEQRAVSAEANVKRSFKKKKGDPAGRELWESRRAAAPSLKRPNCFRKDHPKLICCLLDAPFTLWKPRSRKCRRTNVTHLERISENRDMKSDFQWTEMLFQKKFFLKYLCSSCHKPVFSRF